MARRLASAHRRGLAAVWLLGALFPAALSAADLDLRITSVATGRVVAEKSVTLAPGEEARFVRTDVRLAGAKEPVDLVLAVTLDEETATSVTVAVHGMVRAPGSPTPLAWTARTYTLDRGSAAEFRVEAARGAAPLAFAVRNGRGPETTIEGAEVRLTTIVRVTEMGADGPRLIEEQRVRLVGPGATEVVLDAGPSGEHAGAALVLRLVPRSRTDAHVVLDLALEARGRTRVLREESFELGFDDRVEVHALEGRGGPVMVEIRPER